VHKAQQEIKVLKELQALTEPQDLQALPAHREQQELLELKELPAIKDLLEMQVLLD
tara:strand:+ start:733 stop:900 length:168 start_codon:yes stop_codon:yes gene_type:complete